MSTVNELLDMAKRELANLKSGEIFLVRDLLKDTSGIEYHEVTDFSLAPYSLIISRMMIWELSR